MENKTGLLLTDDTPRYEHLPRYSTSKKNDPDDICIQLKARHFVTCPSNDAGFVCVEDDCMGCQCYDGIHSTEHTILCNAILNRWDKQRLHVNKNKIVRDWIESEGEAD